MGGAIASASYQRIFGANQKIGMALIGSGRRAGENPRQCSAHEEALARPDVEAMLIAVPDHLHVQLGCTALAARRHVYLGKPTTHRFSGQNRLRDSVRGAGKVLQCGTQQCSGEHDRRAKEEIFDKGKLGVEAGIQVCNPGHLALDAYWMKSRVEWGVLG